MTNVYISVINFNSAPDTRQCLQTLEKLHNKNFDLAVSLIDNASEEPLNIKPDEYKSLNLTIFRNNENLGFAGGHNISIKYALKKGADYVLILNNDTLTEDKMLYKLLSALESNKQAGIAAPKIYFAPGYEFHKDRYSKDELGKVIWYAGGIMDWGNVLGHHRGVDEVDRGQYNESEKTAYASGCCMLIRRNVLEKVGLFDERYFLYYEDNDFNERVKKAGFSIAYTPGAVLWHKNAGSSGGSGSPLQDYFITRNRLLFGLRYAPVRTKFALLRESIRILFDGREWQKKGIRDFYLRRFGQGSYNV